MHKQVRLLDIRLEGTQSRAEINQDAVADYTALMSEGVEFPELTVFYDGADYWLADGFHRFFAARHAELKSYKCDIRSGGQREALLFSLGANQWHGCRRTNDDKRRSVEICLADKEWGKFSDRAIADMCGVGHQLVAQVRACFRSQLDDSSSSDVAAEPEKRIGRDNKARRQPKKNGTDATSVASGIDIESLAEPYREMVSSLKSHMRRVADLVEDPAYGPHLGPVATRVRSHLQEAVETLAQVTPTSVCQGCSGVGCNTCRGTGIWTRAIEKGRAAT